MNSFPDLYITQLLPRLEGIKKVNGIWVDLMTGRAVSDAKFEWAMKNAIMKAQEVHDTEAA